MAERFGRIIIPRYGGPEVLEIGDAELREPRAGEVRVKMLAAGVSWVESMLRHGAYPDQPKPPLTPGYDVVGIVDRGGEGTSRFKAGDTVAALMALGSHAEYVYVAEEELVPVPAGLDPGEAVCLVLNYVTAYQMLHRVARLQGGQRILVHSAAGGVGTALVELASLAGLESYGTASHGKLDLVSRLGAHAIDYRSEDFVAAVHALAADGVDAAFDAIGGTNWLRSSRCLARGGVLVAFGAQGALAGGVRHRGTELAGFASGALLYLLQAINRRRFTFYSITAERRRHADWFVADLTALFQLLAAGKIHPIVARRFPWRDARAANELLESGTVQGKIVLTAG